MVWGTRLALSVPVARARWACGVLAVFAHCGCASSPGAPSASDRDASAESPRPGCITARIAPGELVEVEIEHDELLREYWLYVGANVKANEPTPLLLNFHGLTSDPERQERISNAARLADEHGIIVAYPRGISRSFNGGVCCGQVITPANDADDVGFSRAIVQDVGTRVCVDERRVYSTGMSNGGFMTEYNGCESADVFAAIAPVSAMGLMQPTCEPSRPIALIAFNGTDDRLISYEGSQASVAAWVERNGCQGDPIREQYGESYCDAWKDCENGVEVVACTLAGMTHCWPGSSANVQTSCESADLMDIDATEMLWGFLERFTLPE